MFVIKRHFRYYFLEYTNELCTRVMIEEILLHCDVPDCDKKRISEIDREFKELTVEVKKSLDKEYSFWFFYRIPPERIPAWECEELEF